MNLYYAWTKVATHCGAPRILFIWAEDALDAVIAVRPYLNPTEKVGTSDVQRIYGDSTYGSTPMVLENARKRMV